MSITLNVMRDIVRASIIVLPALYGSLILGLNFGNYARFSGFILGLSFGILLVLSGAFRSSYPQLPWIIGEAKRVKCNWDGKSKHGRKFVHFSLYILALIGLNAALWANAPQPPGSILDSIGLLLVDFWSPFLPVIDDHYSQILAYAGQDRAERVARMYATSWTLLILLFLILSRLTFRGYLVHAIVAFPLVSRTKKSTYKLTLGFFAAASMFAWFAMMGFGMDFGRHSPFSAAVPGNYIIGDSYWVFWMWGGTLWFFVWFTYSFFAFSIVLRHWSLFFGSNVEGK